MMSSFADKTSAIDLFLSAKEVKMSTETKMVLVKTAELH